MIDVAHAQRDVVWWDHWGIPAPTPTAAYEFINYAYEPDSQAQIGGGRAGGADAQRRVEEAFAAATGA